ncbi:hypothetical protein J108_23575 [Mycobacteroides abscessus subsp. bolletii CRM-0020]|uniref:PE family protein n=2 Tax=Mycobacteroides abscessus TaxID=36809 RepID=A0A829HNS3_9MYCO|nr:hypothetical protein J108_23575 [Mycobacteroides abscessus subsp. bolletii CRM-0020]
MFLSDREALTTMTAPLIVESAGVMQAGGVTAGAAGAAAGTTAAAGASTSFVAPGTMTPASMVTATRFSLHGQMGVATGMLGAKLLAEMAAALSAAGLGFLLADEAVAVKLLVP